MNILISGCGIAGITAALYLQRHQHRITIVERGASGEHKGYGISLKGFGVDIMKELGLYSQLSQIQLPIDHYSLYDASGQFIRGFSNAMINEMTGEAIAVSRGGLHKILFESLGPSVTVRYNTSLQSVVQTNDSVLVTFNNKEQDTYDLVIVAEGLRSSTRKMLWSDGGIKSFDIMYAAAIIQTRHGFSLREARTYKGVGRSISIFPVLEDQLAIQASFRSRENPHYSGTLADKFAGFAKEITKLLDTLHDSGAVFYDKVAMVDTNEYSSGRTVLLGDAAYCPSFLSGMGASLGMLGAKLLAYEINMNRDDLQQGIRNYRMLMLPLAKHFQKNAVSNIKRELPGNRVSERVSKFIMKYVPDSLIKKKVKTQLLAETTIIRRILTLPM